MTYWSSKIDIGVSNRTAKIGRMMVETCIPKLRMSLKRASEFRAAVRAATPIRRVLENI